MNSKKNQGIFEMKMTNKPKKGKNLGALECFIYFGDILFFGDGLESRIFHLRRHIF